MPQQKSASRTGLWVEVEPGFHVGNDHGHYLGSVAVSPEGGISAFGARSEFLGRFDEVADAKAVVVSSRADAPVREQPSSRSWTGIFARSTVVSR